MRKLFGAILLAVAAVGTLTLALPMPTAGACKYCRPIQCPPCYQLAGGNCNKCATCQKIPGCTA